MLVPLFALSFTALANVAVIVHPSNAAVLTQDDINKIYQFIMENTLNSRALYSLFMDHASNSIIKDLMLSLM